MVKYLVAPGYVISNNDNDRHYIGFVALCRLYKVNPNECLEIKFSVSPAYRDLPVLTPRSDGDYSLPVGKEANDKPAKPTTTEDNPPRH